MHLHTHAKRKEKSHGEEASMDPRAQAHMIRAQVGKTPMYTTAS